MPKVIVLIGPSNSGKSTWSYNYLEKNPNTMRFNRDDYRKMLRYKTYLDDEAESFILKIMYDSAVDAIISGYDIILDNTHCRIERIKEVISMFEDIADIEFVKMERVTYLELVKRSKIQCIEKGCIQVPEWMLKKHLLNLRELCKSFDFAPIKRKK